MRMLIVPTDDVDVLTIQTAGGCFAIFGLPLLILGVVADSAVVALLLGFGNRPPSVLEFVFIAVLALAFTIVGALLVFGRSGFVLNRHSRQVRSWDWLSWWHRTTDFELSTFARLALVKYWNPSKSGYEWLFRIELCPHDGPPLVLGNELGEQVARRNIATLSKFLALEIVEVDTGDHVE